MSSGVRNTAARRREVEARRLAWLEGELARLAELPLEEWLEEQLADRIVHGHNRAATIAELTASYPAFVAEHKRT